MVCHGSWKSHNVYKFQASACLLCNFLSVGLSFGLSFGLKNGLSFGLRLFHRLNRAPDLLMSHSQVRRGLLQLVQGRGEAAVLGVPQELPVALQRLGAQGVRQVRPGVPGAQFNSIKNGPKTAPKMASKWNFEKRHMSQLNRVKSKKGPKTHLKKGPKSKMLLN